MTKLKINNSLDPILSYPIVKESLERGGYLVGSSANYLINSISYNDIDIIFTNEYTYTSLTQEFIKQYDYTINKFGGIKYICDNMNVDIWYSSLERYIINHKSKEVGNSYIYYYKDNLLIEFKNY